MLKSVKICSMFRGKGTSRKMISIVKEAPAQGPIEHLVIESAKEASKQLGEPVRFRGWFEFDA